MADVRFLGPVERMMYLRTLPLFGSLPARHLAVIARFAEERRFRAGAVLLEEGRPVDAIHILVEGNVRVSRQGRVFRRFGQRDAVGVIGLLARTDEGVRAEAQTDCVTLEIGGRSLFRIFEEHFAIYHHILRETARVLIGERGQLGLGDRTWPSRAAAAAVDLDGPPVDLVDRIAALRAGLPFGQRHPLPVAQLARCAGELRLSAGEPLWHRGDAANTFYVPVAGTIACHVEAGLLLRAGPGGVAGLVPTLAETRYASDAVAESALIAVTLRYEHLLDVLEDHHEIAAEGLAAVAADVLELFIHRAETEADVPSGLRTQDVDGLRQLATDPHQVKLRP